VTQEANDSAQLLPAVERIAERLQKSRNRWWPTAATPREGTSRRWLSCAIDFLGSLGREETPSGATPRSLRQ